MSDKDPTVHRITQEEYEMLLNESPETFANTVLEDGIIYDLLPPPPREREESTS